MITFKNHILRKRTKEVEKEKKIKMEKELGLIDYEKKRVELPKERPIHEPTQITNASQLIPGRIYLEKRVEGGNGRKIRFEGLDKDGKWARANNLDTGFTVKFSLADRCVIPYEAGFWNPSNYLVPCDD